MTKGFKQTAEGIELSYRTAMAIGGFLVFLITMVTLGVRKNDLIAGAVQRPEFTDTTAAIRRDLTVVGNDAKVAAERAQSVSCYMAKYPAGLCDNVTRPGVQQAGTSSRAKRP